jgi:hypothetical protein
MMAKRVLWAGAIMLLGASLVGGSCRVRTDSPGSLPSAPEGGEGAAAKAAAKPLDIGDAEAALRVTLTIPKPVAANVGVEELRDMRQDLNMVTVNVAPPHPTRLDVDLTVKSSRDFAERPLAVRVSVLRDGQPIESQALVVAADARKDPFSYTFDAMKGLAAAPATMLLYAQAEIVMLPAGTDAASVDPAAVTATPETTGSKVGNPLRVNFTGQAAAP